MKLNSLSSVYSRNRGTFLQASILMGIWLILSGKFEAIYIFWGALSVAFVLRLCHNLHTLPMAGASAAPPGRIILHRLIAYLLWLQWQIIKSGVYVAWLVLHPKMPVNPMLVRFKSRQPNMLAKVILGNSITLTPGTLTVEIRDDNFLIHALTENTEQELVSGEMETRVARLYLRECKREDMCTDVELFTSGRGGL